MSNHPHSLFEKTKMRMAELDIEAELQAHKALTEYNEKSKAINEANKWIKSFSIFSIFSIFI